MSDCGNQVYRMRASLLAITCVSGNLSKVWFVPIRRLGSIPQDKYLYHSFVESPDMMNIYNGNVVTDGSGRAIITLPGYFESLNTEFRYQLTTIGSPAKAWVATEVANNQFTIKTDKGNVAKVSWQVTGIRQDAWANAPSHPE